MRPSRLLAAFAPSMLSMLVACGDDGGGTGGSGASSGTSSGSTTASSGDGGGDASSSSSAGGDDAVQLAGAVEKGPFILGSQITVSALDASLAPTGDTFETETTSDLGEFSLAAVPAGPLAITGSGFFYNEVLGELSSAELTLRALFVPSGGGAQTAYVNIVTHLTKQRVEALVAGGAAFADAVAQAEQELQDELAITLPSFDAQATGVEMNIAGGDTDANAYLFAVSSVLVQVVIDEGDGSVEARLQELLNAMAAELAGGSLASDTRERVATALPRLRVGRVAQGFADRLQDLDVPAVVPDMNRVLDQDGDGLVNIDDACPLVADPDQDDVDDDGRGDACDACPELDCATDCVPAAESATGADVCATLCEETNDCLFGETCSGLGAEGVGDVKACAPACDLDGGGSDCPDGHVCLEEGGEGSCQPRGDKEVRELCETNAECRPGLACNIVVVGLSDRACVQPCGISNDCDNGYCVESESGADSYCFADDLPDGVSCDPALGSAECAGDSRCGIGAACQGTFCCQPTGGLGEACVGSGYQGCDDGLACAADASICQPHAPVAPYDINPCCVPAGEVGQPCLEQDDLAPDETTCGDGLCLGSPEQCASYTGCCAGSGALNQFCDAFELACEGGLECVEYDDCDLGFARCCRPIE